MRCRLMLHDVLSVNQSRSPQGHPVAFSTTAGTLFLTGGGDPVTLSVTVAQVPELSSLSFLALGAFGLIANRLRLRKNS